MTPTKGYTEMKDSGIHWMGKIPKHWDLIRAKFHFTQTNSRGNEVPILLAASQKNGVCPQSWLEGVVQVSENTDLQQFKTVHKNDFVISLRSFQGGFERSDFEGVCSPAYQVFHADNAFDNNYLKYLFKNELFIDEMNSLTVGIREGRNIKYEDFANSLILVPPLSEQSAIAAYLDTQCAKIDEIIAQAKASIEDYKQWKASIIYEAVTKGLDPNVEMKDSGIEWIGRMPKEWKAIPLKVCTSKIGSGKTPLGGAETYQDNGVLFLRSQNVYNTGLELDGVYYISDEIDSTMKNSRVRYNDVLLNITGGSIGRCCLFDLPDTAANVNQHVCIIRTKPEILLPQFLRYFWNSAAGPMVIEQYQTGSNRQGLNFEQIGATHIPLCSIAEQQQIVAMLDQKCAVINQLMAEKQSLIDDLESYKKSLIYEVVTGKRRVV